MSPLSCERIRIYPTPARAKSSSTTQIRTEIFGFAGFLNGQRVLDVLSVTWQRGWAHQTARDVIKQRRINHIKEQLSRTGRVINY